MENVGKQDHIHAIFFLLSIIDVSTFKFDLATSIMTPGVSSPNTQPPVSFLFLCIHVEGTIFCKFPTAVDESVVMITPI